MEGRKKYLPPDKYLHGNLWGVSSNANTWPLQIKSTTQEDLPVACQAENIQDFLHWRGDLSGIPSDKPTKDPHPVSIIKSTSVRSEIPTKFTSRLPKDVPSAKPRNILFEFPSGYPTGAPRTISNYNPSSKPIARTIINQDIFKRGIQEAQFNSQINQILAILHITLSSDSRQRDAQMCL